MAVKKSIISFWDPACYLLQFTEDCLVLTVSVPATLPYVEEGQMILGSLPVMVYLHGGALSLGSGNDPKYNGRYLASKTDTIIITINYRLGEYKNWLQDARLCSTGCFFFIWCGLWLSLLFLYLIRFCSLTPRLRDYTLSNEVSIVIVSLLCVENKPMSERLIIW